MTLGGQGAKAQLRGRVQELGSELQSAEEEVAALEGLQEQLGADVGADEQIQALVAAAVAREHAVQESRNRKVLDLLSSKVRPALHASNSLRMVLNGHRAPLAVSAALWLCSCLS